MKQNPLFDDMSLVDNVPPTAPLASSAADCEAAPRLRRPERLQVQFLPQVLDDLVPADHEVRRIWKAVCAWDLSLFLQTLRARGEQPGRASTDPRLLIALWLYAYSQGMGNGRELARLCEVHHAYRWLCGGVSINYHTLNDFRVSHGKALNDLLTQMLGVLTSKGLVQVKRISQDGTRVRAKAGGSSFHRRETLEKHLVAAREHLQQVQAAADDPQASAQQKAAWERAAREEEEQLQAALQELTQLEQAKAAQKEKPSKHRPPRASTTDPEARSMRTSDGGTRPAYNVQLGVDPQSQAIVAVTVTNAGSDAGQSTPLRQQIEQRTGQKVEEQLQDGGYVSLAEIDQAGTAGVKIYMPVPHPKRPDAERYLPKKTDSPAVAEWRQRMGTAEAQTIYKERAASVERANADLKTYRGLKQFTVRGLKRVQNIALWSVLAYNFMLFREVWSS